MILAQSKQISLHNLLRERAVDTYFQPIISIKKKSIIGLEALSRGVNSSTNELIPPNVLFETAIQNNCVVELDRLCREKALENFKRVSSSYGQVLLFLNFDTSIIDQGVVGSGHLIQFVERLGLSPSSVVLEIIESKVNDIKALKAFIDSYKNYGFLIALDDIGNGHSNLDRILHVRPHIIKIDRWLVSEVDKDYYKRELFKALAGMAKKTGALVVAEGVETFAEAITTLELGADMLQGYYFAKPLPDAEVRSEIISQKASLVAAAYKNSKIENINARMLREKSYNELLELAIDRLVNVTPEQFESKLQEMASKHSFPQCYYILNLAGIQITNTISTSPETGAKVHNMFRADFRGADQSLKDYHVFVYSGLDRHITEPYMSLANGQPCVTCSAVFEDYLNNRYILCIDFNP